MSRLVWFRKAAKNPKTMNRSFLGDKTTSKADDEAHRANAALLQSFFSVALSKMLSETVHHFEEKSPDFRDLAAGDGVQAMLVDKLLQNDYNIVYMAKLAVAHIPHLNCNANYKEPPNAYDVESDDDAPSDNQSGDTAHTSYPERNKAPAGVPNGGNQLVSTTVASVRERINFAFPCSDILLTNCVFNKILQDSNGVLQVRSISCVVYVL